MENFESFEEGKQKTRNSRQTIQQTITNIDSSILEEQIKSDSIKNNSSVYLFVGILNPLNQENDKQEVSRQFVLVTIIIQLSKLQNTTCTNIK